VFGISGLRLFSADIHHLPILQSRLTGLGRVRGNGRQDERSEEQQSEWVHAAPPCTIVKRINVDPDAAIIHAFG
jgi:hypothetical protein